MSNAMNKLKLLLAAASCALMLGCASDGIPLGVTRDMVDIKAYEGPARPRAELAHLKPLPGIYVIDVDGDFTVKEHVQVHGFRYQDIDIAVAPGRHVLHLDFIMGGVKSRGTIKLPVDVRAGRQYLIRSVSNEPSIWRPALEDVTDRPERWCVFANDLPAFKGCPSASPASAR